jgi:hypothetical protein
VHVASDLKVRALDLAEEELVELLGILLRALVQPQKVCARKTTGTRTINQNLNMLENVAHRDTKR